MRGILLIEDDSEATLNMIRSESKPQGAGKTIYSTTTMTIAFAKEGGQWKVKQ